MVSFSKERNTTEAPEMSRFFKMEIISAVPPQFSISRSAATDFFEYNGRTQGDEQDRQYIPVYAAMKQSEVVQYKQSPQTD